MEFNTCDKIIKKPKILLEFGWSNECSNLKCNFKHELEIYLHQGKVIYLDVIVMSAL